MIKKLLKKILTSGSSLNKRFIVMTVFVLLVTMLISAYLNVIDQKSHFLVELKNRGKSLGNFIALTSSDAVLGQDFILMNLYMEEISKQPDILYGIILTPSGDNLTSYLNYHNKLLDLSDVDQWKNTNFLDLINHIDSQGEIITMKFPIGTPVIGTLKLGLSTKNISKLTSDALTRQLIEIFLIITFLSICIYLLFKINVSYPINELINSISQISSGNLNHKATALSNDELGSLVESFNSMTEALKKSNSEKDSVVEQLQKLNVELQAATHSKSIFLANMSHEIRTPLTAIIGFGHYLRKPDINENELNRAINAITENGVHLQNIINDILDLSKIEAGKLDIEKSEVSLFNIISEIEDLIQIQCDNKNLTLSFQYVFPLPEKISTDPVRFKQVLINLLSNAVKFTEHGSITLKTSYDTENNKLHFTVRDTGIGLSPEQQQYIFEDFSQADTTTTRQYGGTGLGLPISLKLARALGGDITVKSAEDFGSKFTFTLDPGAVDPQQFVEEIPGKTLANQQVTPILKTQNLEGSILIAEDNEHNQQLLKLYIESPTISLDIVDNGKKAVDYALRNHYDLILMDMQMPVMDGLEAVRKLRNTGYTKPIAALTANAMLDNQKKCLAAGCSDFLSKPIDEHNLNTILNKYLHNTSQADSSTEPDSEKYNKKIRHIMNNFIDTLPDATQSLYDSYRNRDWDTVMTTLHALKGTSGNLGFHDLMDIAHELEKKVEKNHLLELDDIERISHLISKIHPM